jgi:hypothetical protein
MASYNKFNAFTKAMAEKVHNLASDNLKVMLTNTAPVATNAVKTDITEIAAGGGYTAGGTQATLVSSSQTSGTYKLVLNNVVFTATTGFGPFRYVVLYNSTATNGELIGWYDYGSAITLNASETFTDQFDATNGVFTVV